MGMQIDLKWRWQWDESASSIIGSLESLGLIQRGILLIMCYEYSSHIWIHLAD